MLPGRYFASIPLVISPRSRRVSPKFLSFSLFASCSCRRLTLIISFTPFLPILHFFGFLNPTANFKLLIFIQLFDVTSSDRVSFNLTHATVERTLQLLVVKPKTERVLSTMIGASYHTFREKSSVEAKKGANFFSSLTGARPDLPSAHIMRAVANSE